MTTVIDNKGNNRIAWVDVLKCLGMLAIFYGHMGSETRIFNFVFYYHVPLFFFISGMFAVDVKKYSLKEAIIKHVKNIVIPYIFLCAINMMVLLFAEKLDFWTFIKWSKQLLFGIRNQMPVAALWFFSCLFVISVLFDILHVILRNKYVLMIVSIILYIASISLFPNRPDVRPSWIFNVDSACMYIMYYTIGFCIREQLFAMKNFTGKRRVLFYILTLLLSFNAFLVYTGHDKVLELLSIINSSICNVIAYPVRALLLIMFNVCLAMILSDSSCMAYAGSNSLWLCGNEGIVRRFMEMIMVVIGGAIPLNNELYVIVYGIVMMMVILKIIYPAEYYLYKKYEDVVDRLPIMKV